MSADSTLKLLARMMLVALVIGTSVTVAATERVDLSLVLSGMLGWSVVPLLQVFTGLLLVRGTPGPRVGQLDAYFATHWPWSLWLLSLHAVLLVAPPARGYVYWLAVTAAIPVVWTIRLLVAYCREHVGLTRRVARVRVIQHQVSTLVLALVWLQFAVGLWPRVIGFFA